MRIAFNTIPSSLTQQLSSLSSRQNRLQNQAATGKRVSQLDDEPATMQRVMDLQARNSQTAQYRKNIVALQGQATASYTAISGVQTIAARAGEIATLADGTRSPQELAAYASEISQMIQHGVQQMNSTWEGDYIFGGTKNAQPPYAITTDASGNVTGVTYQGNNSVSQAEVGQGATMSAETVGENTTGAGPAGVITDSRTGADLFNHLISLQNHLLAGNTTAIASTDLPALAKDEDNITSRIADNGLTQSRLDAADSLAQSQSQSLKQMVSNDSDADLADTLTKLSATQTAYQAALQSGAKLLGQNGSLMDYLR